jgi:hypothetical protein
MWKVVGEAQGKLRKVNVKPPPHHLPQMCKIQNISINVEKSQQLSINLDNS